MSESGSTAWPRLRSRAILSTRDFFSRRGFEEVFTPLMSREAGTEPHLKLFRTADRFLVSSPELAMKGFLADIWIKEKEARPSIFQCSSVFRDGEPEDSGLHTREFTMLEYYQPCESLGQAITFFSNYLDELFQRFHLPGELTRPVVVSVPELFFQRTGMAFVPESRVMLDVLRRFNPRSARLQKPATASHWLDLFFEVWASVIDPWLETQDMVALTHFPAAITSMARPSPELPGFVERFEFVFRGIELCNGYMETFDPAILRNRMNEDLRRMEQDRPLPEKWLAHMQQLWDATRGRIPSMCGVAAGLERICLSLCSRKGQPLPPIASFFSQN